MRALAALGLAVGIGVAAFGVAQPARASLDIVVSVSPLEVQVGQAVEVQVRTFLPFDEKDLHLPVARPAAYPAASGLWDILYPVEYPFDVDATADGVASIPVTLHRDGADATLWRGTFTPTSAGTWTVRMNNWQDRTATVGVSALAAGSFPGGTAMAAALIAGLVIGVALGRFGRFRPRVR
jgi:hypothetical protein